MARIKVTTGLYAGTTHIQIVSFSDLKTGASRGGRYRVYSTTDNSMIRNHYRKLPRKSYIGGLKSGRVMRRLDTVNISGKSLRFIN